MEHCVGHGGELSDIRSAKVSRRCSSEFSMVVEILSTSCESGRRLSGFEIERGG
jgi:hypothetical protein